jgi:octaprenyl-diphosphate synthase
MSEGPAVSDTITGPISKELGLLEDELRRIFSSKVALVSAIGEHLASTGGKRIRPTVVLLSAKIGEPSMADAIRVSAAVEIIHTATLLHDDSIDRSDLRRGLPTVNTLWNDQVSVIMGDHLFCTAFRLLHDARMFDIASVLSVGSDRMTFGEMFQMDLRGRYDIPEETYLDMVRHKTAALFSSACEAGAMVGGLSGVEASHLRRFGECVGMAFQVVDDILDFVGDVGQMGKPVGNDLRDGRVTLPLLVSLRNAGEKDAAGIKDAIRHGDFDEHTWGQVVSFIETHGGIDYSRQAAGALAHEAKTHIADLRDCPAKSSLILLADRLVSRRR